MTLTLVIVLILSLQYAACVGFYHANERRGMVDSLNNSKAMRMGLKACAWCLLIVSLFLCADLQSWERGIPIWLCLIGVAGFVSLYVSAYKPTQHINSGLTALFLVLLLSATLLLVDNRDNIAKQVVSLTE